MMCYKVEYDRLRIFKSRSIKVILALWIAALASSRSSSAAEETEPPHGKRYVYKEAHGVPQEMEIYFPEGWSSSDRRPAFILFHGGGWGNGSLAAFRYQCDYFARRGMVAATVNYTLAKKQSESVPGVSRKRVCIVDAKSAIRWVKQNADTFGVDTEQIVAGGGSAGGHISLLATNNLGLNDPQDPENLDTSVAAYVLFNPAFAKIDEKDAEVDFLQHIDSEFPPSIVFFGTEDKWLRGWREIEKKMNTLEFADLELWMAPRVGHAFFNKQPWKDLTLIEADRFLAGLGFLDGDPALATTGGSENLVRVEDSMESIE